MKKSHWSLCVRKNCDWFRKITPLSNLTRASPLVGMKTYSESRIEQFFSSEQPCEPKSLNVALQIPVQKPFWILIVTIEFKQCYHELSRPQKDACF